MAFDSKHFLYYFRVTPDRRLLFGGRAEFSRPSPETTRRAAAILRRGMTTVFPELAAHRIDYAWGGNVAFTRDQMPRAEPRPTASTSRVATAATASRWRRTWANRSRVASPASRSTIRCSTIASGDPALSGNPWFLPLVGAYYKVKDWIR